MDNFQLGGVVSAIVALLLYLKIELIKEMVKKVISDKEKITFFSFAFLIVVAIIPTLIGYGTSEVKPSMDSEGTKDAQVQKQKTDAEVILEGGEKVLSVITDAHKENQARKHQQDSTFKANRPQRWVYQIGDVMDNDEGVLETYKKLYNTDNICLFKDGNNFFLFKDVDRTKDQLQDSLQNYKSQINSTKIIDLMSYCTSDKYKIKKTKSKKLGRRKDKIKLECYTVED